MLKSLCGLRFLRLLVFVLCALPCWTRILRAQEQSSSAPKVSAVGPKVASLRITFLPPPLEGTLSIGVYDRSGKKVRSLHTEASAADFTPGLNGFITSWDGRDDLGQLVPPGKYHVRGLAVGDLELTGEAFHGNDWVAAEEGPHPVSFHSVRLDGGNLELLASDLVGRLWRIIESLSQPEDAPRFESIPPEGNATAASAPGPTNCPGRDGTRWSIEKPLGETVVVQFDAQGEVLRRLSIGAGQPLPVAIAASMEADEVFLLEQDGERWRLRGLRKKVLPDVNATDAVSNPAEPSKSDPAGAIGVAAPVWETFFEKNRWPCARFSEAATRVGRPKPFTAEAQVQVKSQFNPLLAGAASDVGLAVGFDGDGSFLKSADGLLLRRLTDTPKLRWAVLGRDARQPALVLLQSDGAVVEEYRILQPGALMTFDAGEYQWTGK